MTVLEQYQLETPEQWRRDQVQHLSAAGAHYRLEGNLHSAIGCEEWAAGIIAEAESEEELEALVALSRETIARVVNGEIVFYKGGV